MAMKTPGVYIVEKNAFPNSVVEVATAVPAFIGYTEKADNKGKPLHMKPWRITSMAEYESYFGGAPAVKFEINDKPAHASDEADINVDGKAYYLGQSAGKYLLYRCMQLFFKNGGGPCFIVSVGDYGSDIKAPDLEGGIAPLIKEQEPTMVVIPETVRLDRAGSQKVQQAALQHCGAKMKSRVAILDVHDGFKERQDPAGDCVMNFREDIGINDLDFAAAYYPWVNTSIVEDSELNFGNIGNPGVLQQLLQKEVDKLTPAGEEPGARARQLQDLIDRVAGAPKATKPKDEKAPKEEKGADSAAAASDMPPEVLNKALLAMSPLFKNIVAAMKTRLNQLPPAAAMAGIYTMVDNSRGVWKAPANVSLNAVVSPAVNISHDDQEDLNVPTNGKAINAIRSFIGEGVLIWGARTLDGNSLDWRYINVRRTMIMLEESIRLAAKAYVFEPNDANTWVTVKSMIRNFLTGIWKRGGLAGAVPEDAFSVHVGLGETMTSEDILEGIMRVTVLVAVTRPAEFIEITFQQQMQKS